ncbi:hypothetical protein M378DRAFT_158417 [Amanita muscaria Koide BX008]|uniref:Uncharacterized protein n=1 Tax=Amanita muscaria (strain Koide BX008) TaxID=946122 RepID=A0A0C2SYL0_AMAMK|nr:hypothetical protein M378DRAFT_158417 [Amanita muscaria Koide BX008]
MAVRKHVAIPDRYKTVQCKQPVFNHQPSRVKTNLGVSELIFSIKSGQIVLALRLQFLKYSEVTVRHQ